ncbi:hypothetical protein [Salinimicrobium terrae]|uniref:hypothetical protein n=1 Tax=Salinimicrobium terrae TaxID=470866 RepID=UPI0003FCF129|nr:hypothetical protein [Salinimicrobium terrae]
MGEGNALDKKFAGNSNPGGITIAYGLSLAYQLSDKIKIRSGVNSLNLSSKTRNVENNLAGNASALEGNPAGNIHYSAGYGTLDQQLDFIEIPLELEFALIDKQVGVSLIAGASTFFLQENEVTISTAGFTGSLGPANNLNNSLTI